MNAIRSLLGQNCEDLSVVVSDNSSRPEDVQMLKDFCEATNDARLLYVRPDRTLDMSAHWEWAITQAMTRTRATHFSVQYDRKVAKADSVARIAAAAERHPGLLFTVGVDFPISRGDGFDVVPYAGTAHDYEILTSAVVRTSAAGWVDEMGQCWPVLSNCVVPRETLEKVRSRFGSVCDSLTPDAAFGFRFCAVEDRYIHCDVSVAVVYAFHLSNGQAYYRRDTSGTFGDFMDLAAGRGWLSAAPIPGLTLGFNTAFHEYNVVRQAVGDAFPPIDRAGYLRQLATGLIRIPDEAERAAVRSVLVENGWHEPTPRRSLRQVIGDWTRPLRRPLGLVRAPAPPRPRFGREEEAVAFLLAHEGKPAKENPALELLDAKRIVR